MAATSWTQSLCSQAASWPHKVKKIQTQVGYWRFLYVLPARVCVGCRVTSDTPKFSSSVSPSLPPCSIFFSHPCRKMTQDLSQSSFVFSAAASHSSNAQNGLELTSRYSFFMVSPVIGSIVFPCLYFDRVTRYCFIYGNSINKLEQLVWSYPLNVSLFKFQLVHRTKYLAQGLVAQRKDKLRENSVMVPGGKNKVWVLNCG